MRVRSKVMEDMTTRYLAVRGELDERGRRLWAGAEALAAVVGQSSRPEGGIFVQTV
jgi:hypothetical protein